MKYLQMWGLFLITATPVFAAEAEKPAVEAGAVEVRFADNSVLKLKLLDAKLTLQTPYGKLQIPVEEVRRIEFATRVTPEVLKQIEGAIGDLGSGDFAKREAATTTLRKLKEKAYPALLEAARQKDPEVVRRAEALLEELRDSVPDDQLTVRKFDVIETGHSKISGTLEGSTFKAHTSQFGDVALRLTEMRSLRSLGVDPEPDVRNALADPGNVNAYAQQIGKTFAFRVTGVVNNAVWGTDVYTTDSSLAAAAVHAGVLRPGQTGIVRVKIVPSPPAFQSSSRNGVTSNAYNMFVAAFQVLK
jgi:hypothetical protein